MARTIYDTASARHGTTSTTATKTYVISSNSIGSNTFVRDPVVGSSDTPSITALIGDYSSDSYLILSGAAANYNFVASTSSTPSEAATARFRTVESTASAAIELSGAASVISQTQGAKIFFKDTLGTEATFTYSTSSTSATTTFGLSGISTDTAMATKLASCINSVSTLKITATSSGSVVTCKQDVPGQLGNTSIPNSGFTGIANYTLGFSGGNGYADLSGRSLAFTAGGAYSASLSTGINASASVSFDQPSNYTSAAIAKGQIKIKTATASDLNGEYITLAGPTQTKKFVWTTTATKTVTSLDDSGDSINLTVPLDNGDTKTGQYNQQEIYVQINGLTSSYDIATRLQQAIAISGISLNSYVANYTATGLKPIVYLDQFETSGLNGNTTISTDSAISHLEVTSFSGGKSGDSLTISMPGGASDTVELQSSFKKASGEIRFDSKTYVSASVFTFSNSSSPSLFSNVAITMSAASNLDAAATELASAVNNSSTLSSHLTAVASGNRVLLTSDIIGISGNTISVSWSPSVSSVPAAQVAIQGLQNAASGTISDKYLSGGANSINGVLDRINRSLRLNKDVYARHLPVATNCDETGITVLSTRPGTSGNSATIAFNLGVDSNDTSNTIAASSIKLQSTANSANTAISATNFTGGTTDNISTATSVGVTNVFSSETPGSVLASALNESIAQAVSYGVNSSSRSTASGTLLAVSSSVSDKTVVVTMSSAGARGNATIDGTLQSDFTTNNGVFSGGLSKFYVGTSRADYATNLAALVNTDASASFSASVLAEVVMTGSRATGTIAFLNNTASNYSAGKVSITSSNGISKAYEFSSNCGETGEVVSGSVIVYLGNVTSSASVGYADEFLAALNHQDGHRRYIYSRLSSSTLYLTQRRAGSVGYNTITSTATSSYLAVAGFSAPTSSQVRITTQRNVNASMYSVTSSNTGTIYLTRSSGGDPRLTSFVNPRMTSFTQTKTSKLNNFDLTLGGGSEISTVAGQLAYLNPSYQSFFPARTTYNSGGFLNEILNNRNGIYGAPTWKMWNQSSDKKKILQELEKNSLISVVPEQPVPPLSQDDYDTNYSFMQGDGDENALIQLCYGDNPPEWCDEITDGASKTIFTGLALIGDDDGMLQLPSIFKRTKLKRLRSTQIYYEPAVESRHKPLLYEFTSQTLVGQAPAMARQTLFNGLHFFTNKSLNSIYKLKDGEARNYITGSLNNSFLYDFFKTARHTAAGRNFYFRERIYPGELNCRRSVNQLKPEYEEQELLFYNASSNNGTIIPVTASLLRRSATNYLSPSHRLSEIRSFWKTEKRDRVRNIYDVKIAGEVIGQVVKIFSLVNIPTSSLDIPYLPSPVTLDGKLMMPNEVSNYHFWEHQSTPGALPVNAIGLAPDPGPLSKRHFAAGVVKFNSPAVNEWHPVPAQIGAAIIHSPPVHNKETLFPVTSSVIIATTTDTNLQTVNPGGAIFPEDFNDSMIFIRKTTQALGAAAAASLTEMSFHQPYDFSLVSMWPLDFPEHLYSTHTRADPLAGGKLNPAEDGPFIGAIQRVGIAPNRIAINTNSVHKLTDAVYKPTGAADEEVHAGAHIFMPYQGTNQVGHDFSAKSSKEGWFAKQNAMRKLAEKYYEANISDKPATSEEILIRNHSNSKFQVTGAAGELIFSTKPTITLYDRNQGYRYPAPHNMPEKSKDPYNFYTKAIDYDFDGVADYLEDDMPPTDVSSPANSTLSMYNTDGYIDFDPDNPVIQVAKMHMWTMFSESQDSIAGYSTATASMQFLRHAYPYYQPIWRLDKLTGRSPMHNSYLDFSNDVHTMARDYSVVPEYCISDHLKTYQDILSQTNHSPKPLYTLDENRKIVRNLMRQVDYVANFAKIIGSSNFVSSIETSSTPIDMNSIIVDTDGNSPNSLSHSAMTSEYASSKEFYDLEYADYSITPGNIKALSEHALEHWRSDMQSAKFMPKYMQTDTSANFAKLCRQNGAGFTDDENVVPSEIHLTFKAIRKMLPEKDFYPVNRTVTLGSQLIDAFSASIGYSENDYKNAHTGVTDSHKNAAATQSFLEPLMAPGILYNSIKSGMGVSHPIFVDNGSDQHPLYYGDPHPHGDWGPSPFSSLSKPVNIMSSQFSDKEMKRDAKYLLGYGLGWSMGISKSTPTYLMRRPTTQLPFEAIYKPDSLNFMSKFKTYMVDDFFDQNRGEFVAGNLTTAPNRWTYPTSSVQIAITHSGEATMIPIAGDTATGLPFRLHWSLPDTAVGHLDHGEYKMYFRGGQYFLDESVGQTRRYVEYIPTKNNENVKTGQETLTAYSNYNGELVLHHLQHHFKIGTSSAEYATNLAAAINSTGSHFPFHVDTGVLDATGLKPVFTDRNVQLFTASVITYQNGESGVSIHTVDPLVAPHNTVFQIYGQTTLPSPTASYGIPTTAGSALSASVYDNAAGNAKDIKLYFKSTGLEKNEYDPGGTDSTNPNATKDPRSNVAVKIAAHNFKPHVHMNPITAGSNREQRIYESSINNFLAETVNFFIKAQSSTSRYYDFKMPIVASTVKQTNFNVVSGTTYYMSVNLYMGESHVMCEGPRFANLPHAGNWASASMRGAFFGSPMEVIHRDSTLNGPTTGGYETEAEAMSSNLTDPAYHHVTPPYFYGPSSLLIKYEATGSQATIDDIYSASKKTSLYFEEYVTGMTIDEIDPISEVAHNTSPAIFPTSSLSPKVPSKNSVSTGSAARMKLEASVDVWKDGFSLLDIAPLGGLAGNQVPSRAWIMAPKWVCPVLDFGLPATIVRKPTSYNSNDKKILSNRADSIKNTTAFYNYCTGRSMWLGYGVDPYDNNDLSALKAHLEDQKQKIAEIENFFEQHEIAGMEGKPVVHIVDPSQGPDACTPGKKGIYLQISETFPESFGGDIGSSVTFATPFSGSGNQSGYYTNREEVFGAANTGSLVSLLGFDKTSGTGPRPIGQIADSKRVHEAIVAIPYFDSSFAVQSKQSVGSPNMNEDGTPNPTAGAFVGTVDRDLLSTVEIIPGYHFLKIDETFFEKALGAMMVDRLTPEGSGRNTELRSVYKDFAGTQNALQEMDVGQMMRTLLGEGGSAGLGYVLPPEFDFMNNSAVTPFQMVVAPFYQDLDKTDLSNIWQNLAPDPVNRASKVRTGVTLRPTGDGVIFEGGVIEDLVGKDAIQPDAFSLNAPGQFLNASPLAPGFKAANPGKITFKGSPPTTPSDFYAKLRWMVFKVKQRSAMNYDTYKSRQVDMCLEEQGIEAHQTGDAQFVLLNSLGTQELYGSNWPYDFFSLIEKAKIEIEFKVGS